MAIENLQKNEGITSHKSSLLNSHVSYNQNLQPFAPALVGELFLWWIQHHESLKSSLWLSCAAQNSPCPRKRSLQKVPCDNICCWDALESVNCLCPVFIYFICLAMEIAGNQINTFEEVLFFSLELKNGWKITCKSSAMTLCELWQIPLSQHTPNACECLFLPLSVPQEGHSCPNAVLNPCAGSLSALCQRFPCFVWYSHCSAGPLHLGLWLPCRNTEGWAHAWGRFGLIQVMLESLDLPWFPCVWIKPKHVLHP